MYIHTVEKTQNKPVYTKKDTKPEKWRNPNLKYSVSRS
jgi:hypothetical protein